ncbi:MAG TPA: EamA family transporter [Melioribacteraceae bacterium]|nr:EamA family transporter [Melioribacteraceae bacterium]
MEWFFIAFASALLSAASTIFEKKLLFEMNAFSFSLLNSFFNLLFTVPFIFFSDFSSITDKGLLILLIKTILNSAAFYFVMLSLKNLEISKALPLLVLTPGFVALFAFLLLNEPLSINQLLGMGMLLIGTYILEMQAKEDFLEPFKVFVKSKNYRYIITALFLFTATTLLDKYILKDLIKNPKAFLVFQQLFTAIIFFVAALFIKGGIVKILKDTNNDWWKWIILVAVLTIGYRYSQIEAIKFAPAVALVLAVKRISVFFASIIGGKIFNEKNLLQKAIATLILIGGTFFIVR